MIIPITSAKLSVVFPEGKLPSLDPANPSFTLDLGGVKIVTRVNAKAARKLSQHTGAAVLQGKLVRNGTTFELIEAGFAWLEPKIVEPLTGEDTPIGLA